MTVGLASVACSQSPGEPWAGPGTGKGPPQHHAGPPGRPPLWGPQREHPGASIQGLARQTAEPGDVSVVMETLPRASGRTSLPGTVSLCVDFAMRCQGSGACWAGWQGVGKADKSPRASQQPAAHDWAHRAPGMEGGAAAGQALRLGGETPYPCPGPQPRHSLLASLALRWGSCHLRITWAGV